MVNPPSVGEKLPSWNGAAVWTPESETAVSTWCWREISIQVSHETIALSFPFSLLRFMVIPTMVYDVYGKVKDIRIMMDNGYLHFD